MTFTLNAAPDQLSEIIRLLTQDSARPPGALPPHRLEVELTGRALTGDIDVVREVVRALQSVGTRVALDDFGVGASNIFNLCELPFDCIKIDKRFVHGLLEDPRAAACVATMIGLGRRLGVEVVAAGIEDEKTMEFLIWMGCKLGQGYLFSRPVLAFDLAPLLDAWPVGTRDGPDETDACAGAHERGLTPSHG